MPMPPARASAIAMVDSVTVSMFALTMGMFKRMFFVNCVRVLTSFLLCMGVRLGTKRTSSKLKPSRIKKRLCRFDLK